MKGLAELIKTAFERSVLEKIPGYTLVRGLAKRVSGDQSDVAFRPALVELEDALSPTLEGLTVLDIRSESKPRRDVTVPLDSIRSLERVAPLVARRNGMAVIMSF